MNKLRTVIVDDESLARRGLSLRLQDMDQIELVAECHNGQQALKAVAELSPDLVFLDIQMPGMDGFDVIANLQSDEMPLIVFVTAFNEYAVDAFKVHAVDYVLKPIEEERLAEAVERAYSQHQLKEAVKSKADLVEAMMGMRQAEGSGPGVGELSATEDTAKQYPDKISIKDGNEIQFIRSEDIRWVDAAGDYMCIHAGDQTHIMRITMKQLESLLDPHRFLRIHRSTIVNANRITSAQTLNNGEYLLTLECESQLKVSRSYRDKVRHLLTS